MGKRTFSFALFFTVVLLLLALPMATTAHLGQEGCTPGFWKNHLSAWPAPYTPDMNFDDVFQDPVFNPGVVFDFFNPDLTLLQALQQGGGGKARLGRHAVAALLNAHSGSYDDVNYPLYTSDVIGQVLYHPVNKAADLLETYNEYGAPGFCD